MGARAEDVRLLKGYHMTRGFRCPMVCPSQDGALWTHIRTSPVPPHLLTYLQLRGPVAVMMVHLLPHHAPKDPLEDELDLLAVVRPHRRLNNRHTHTHTRRFNIESPPQLLRTHACSR